MHLRLLVIRDADLLDQIELCLEPVDVVLFGVENAAKEVATHVVAARLAVGDRGLQHRMRGELELQVAGERLLDVLADEQLVQVLEVRQPLEKQNALDERFGVLHLVDRRLALRFAEPRESPVLEHLRVDEVLVDRRELVGEDLVEPLDDLRIALHQAVSAATGGAQPPALPFSAATVSWTSAIAHDVHRPQPSPTPSPRARSSGERAPSSAAWTIWRSVIALQMQMYMTKKPLEPMTPNQDQSVSRVK